MWCSLYEINNDQWLINNKNIKWFKQTWTIVLTCNSIWDIKTLRLFLTYWTFCVIDRWHWHHNVGKKTYNVNRRCIFLLVKIVITVCINEILIDLIEHNRLYDSYRHHQQWHIDGNWYNILIYYVMLIENGKFKFKYF